MDDILQKILQRKREEIAARRQTTPLTELKARIAEQPVPRGFAEALRAKIAVNAPAVIAEGIEKARATLTSGQAREKLDQFVAATRRISGR